MKEESQSKSAGNKQAWHKMDTTNDWYIENVIQEWAKNRFNGDDGWRTDARTLVVSKNIKYIYRLNTKSFF